MENSILNDDHEYEQKFELGRAIHEIVNKRGVHQQSLRLERKEPLDLYMKESVESFPVNVGLKPWQNELMKYIQPLEKLSGLLEKMVMKEKVPKIC